MSGSSELLQDATRYLNDASDAYTNISRELSRLDVAYERLLVFVDRQASAVFSAISIQVRLHQSQLTLTIS